MFVSHVIVLPSSKAGRCLCTNLCNRTVGGATNCTGEFTLAQHFSYFKLCVLSSNELFGGKRWSVFLIHEFCRLHE